MPRKRSACVRFAARSPIGRVEVLLPMIASGRAAASMLFSTGPLISGCSSTASSIKSASATASGRLSAARRLARTRSADPASKSPWASKSSASRQQPVEVTAGQGGVGVDDDHVEPRHRQRLRDTATHVAGADDGHALDALRHSRYALSWQTRMRRGETRDGPDRTACGPRINDCDPSNRDSLNVIQDTIGSRIWASANASTGIRHVWRAAAAGAGCGD